MKVSEAFKITGMDHLKAGRKTQFRRKFRTSLASSLSEPAILEAAGASIGLIFDVLMEDILELLDIYFSRTMGLDASDYAILEAGMPNPVMSSILEAVEERCVDALRDAGISSEVDGLRSISIRIAEVIAGMIRDMRRSYISLVVELSDFSGMFPDVRDKSQQSS